MIYYEANGHLTIVYEDESIDVKECTLKSIIGIPWPKGCGNTMYHRAGDYDNDIILRDYDNNKIDIRTNVPKKGYPSEMIGTFFTDNQVISYYQQYGYKARITITDLINFKCLKNNKWEEIQEEAE